MSNLDALQTRLEIFREAGQNLQLDPLISQEDFARLGVEYQTDEIDKLEQAIEDSPERDNKLIFTGHRGCGKSTLLAELGLRLTDTGRYFVVMYSISRSILMSNKI
jgi:ABC-type lipoprotein export system ATPase subunit